MSSILTDAKGKLFAALFAIAAAIALTVAIAPASAYAATIEIYDGDTNTQINSVNTSSLSSLLVTGPVKAQFYKDSTWNVIGGKDYITLDDFLSTYAQTKWASTTNLKFYTEDFPNGYTKYNTTNGGLFAASDLTADYTFFSTIAYNSGTTNLPTATTDYDYEAVLAFTWGSAAQTSSANADGTALTYTTYDQPRLLWGIDDDVAPTSVAGNRFPAGITKIYLYN